jgi:hypothetical protein
MRELTSMELEQVSGAGVFSRGASAGLLAFSGWVTGGFKGAETGGQNGGLIGAGLIGNAVGALVGSVYGAATGAVAGLLGDWDESVKAFNEGAAGILKWR